MNIHDTAISSDANGPSVFKGSDRASFLRQLRKAACKNDFPIDFTKEINGRRCISQTASEQKLWSLVLLTDSILYPYWQNRSHFDDALQDPIVLHKRLTCQAYAHAVPCSQYQIPTETLFAYEPYCCLECEAEPSMTELHREHPGYAKASPCCSEMARAEERASILFDLKGGFNETPYAVDHNARRVQPCEEFKHARSRVVDWRRVMLQLSVKSWHGQ